MKIIDRYILKRFLGAFVFVVLILVLIIVVIDLTEKIEKFGRANLSAMEVIGYYMDFIPFIANLITPITVFIATVFVTAKMAGHTEIIAILSNGMSFRRLLLPYFIGSLLIASLSFALTGWVIPNSNKSRLAFEIQHLKTKYFFDQRNIHMQVAPNVYLYMQSYYNTSDTGIEFTMERIEGTELTEKLTARRIKWNPENEKWTMIDWRRREIDGMIERITQGKEMDTTLIIHPSEFDNDYREFDGMTINELNEHIARLRMRGSSNVEVYEVEKYIRFTSPFAVLILTFMGVIVSARKARGGAGFQIALGFLLSFIYIITFIMTRSIAVAGAFDPALAVWIPNILFALVTMLMYKYVPR
jgi:lipopolysaccharide export system permease protein